MNWYDYSRMKRLRKIAEEIEASAPPEDTSAGNALSPEDRELLDYLQWRTETGRGPRYGKSGLIGALGGAAAGAGIGGLYGHYKNRNKVRSAAIGAAGGGTLGLLAGLGRAALAGRAKYADIANDADYQAWKAAAAAGELPPQGV